MMWGRGAQDAWDTREQNTYRTMHRLSALTGFSTLFLSAWVFQAEAQGFNVRHDAFGRNLGGFGGALEQNSANEFVTFCNEAFLDTVNGIYYPIVLCSERFSASGEFLSEDSVVIPYRTSSLGWSNASVTLPDGRYVVVGVTQDSTPVGGSWIGMFWFEADGTPSGHLELLGDSVTEWLGRGVERTPDGGFVIVGGTTMTGVFDAFLVKTDSLGNVQWWQTYGHPTGYDQATSVDLLPNGGYVIGALYPESNQERVQWVIGTDSAGNVIWEQFFGVPHDWYYEAAVLSTSDGNIVMATGICIYDLIGRIGPQLAKLDPSGTVLWSRTYGEILDGLPAGLFAVVEVPGSGDLVACGQRLLQSTEGWFYYKGFLLRTDADGDSLWMRDYFYYDSVMTDVTGDLRDVQPTSDGGFVAVGQAYASLTGNAPPDTGQDVWLIKVDSLGCIIPGCDDFSTAITMQVTNLGSALTAFPNPARGSIKVKVALPGGAPFARELYLRLVSAQGGEVLVQRAVLGENALDVRSLAAGAYHLHLTSGSTWLGGTALIVE